MAGFAARWRNVAAMVGAMALSGCLFDSSTVSRDFSGFDTYAYSQSPGLGFCADPEALFSVVLRRDAGAVTMQAEGLRLVGTDPTQCEDTDIDAEAGCYRPEALPERQLSAAEVADVEAVFAKVTWHPRPDRMCRTIAFDPCVIARHDWDGSEVADYICGANRMTEAQDQALTGLLARLQGE